jgi:hypothetical protein
MPWMESLPTRRFRCLWKFHLAYRFLCQPISSVDILLTGYVTSNRKEILMKPFIKLSASSYCHGFYGSNVFGKCLPGICISRKDYTFPPTSRALLVSTFPLYIFLVRRFFSLFISHWFRRRPSTCCQSRHDEKRTSFKIADLCLTQTFTSDDLPDAENALSSDIELNQD